MAHRKEAARKCNNKINNNQSQQQKESSRIKMHGEMVKKSVQNVRRKRARGKETEREK